MHTLISYFLQNINAEDKAISFLVCVYHIFSNNVFVSLSLETLSHFVVGAIVLSLQHEIFECGSGHGNDIAATNVAK